MQRIAASDESPQKIPPTVLQSRTSFQPCTTSIPGLASNLLSYFEQQVERGE